jgi:hypothetical protein
VPADPDLPPDAVFIVEPGGKISYKHIGERPSLGMLAAKTRR